MATDITRNSEVAIAVFVDFAATARAASSG